MNRAKRYISPAFRRPLPETPKTYTTRVLYACEHMISENIVAGSAKEALIIAKEISAMPCRNCSGITDGCEPPR